ncbi:MAG: ABC transporter substrate-binding protein [Pseudomonadota bacterium]
MANHRNRFPARRRFLKQTAALSAGAATLAAPAVVLGRRPPAIKVGVLHPVTGALAASGVPCREGALMAIEDINAAGGIKSMGGARLEAVLGDAQSRPQAGASEVEKMNEAGVAAIVGAYASSICLATTQAAARHGIAHIVDVGVADRIVERGLKNTFRFGPGHRTVTQIAMQNLHVLNTLAGKPAKTVMIVHEESLFGTGTANLLAKELPTFGYEVKEIVRHANPTRDFNDIVLRMKAINPDIVIPANDYNEYALLVRTMRRQKIVPMAVYSVLGGAASNDRFVKEFPDAANGIIDVNYWFNPKDRRVAALRKRVEDKGGYFVYGLFMNYTAMWLLADALERAKSATREDVIAALETSTFASHFMPYGPTRFVNGQNEGARPLVTQVLNNEIKVIGPQEFRQADPVFPLEA